MVAGQQDARQAMETAMEVRQTSTALTTSLTYAFFVVFGIGSWVTVNGLFSELPLLVVSLPEGWRLGSVLAVVVQLANIGPVLLYCLRWCHFKTQRLGSEQLLLMWATYIVLGLGAISMAMLASTWHITVDLFGAEQSIPLLFFTFVAALADCTSSMIFWRFAGAFKTVHISALAAGEGLSGAVVAVLVWMQDAAAAEPRFSAGVYFALLGVVMLISALAYHLLRRAPFAHAERAGAEQTGTLPLQSAGDDLATGFARGSDDLHIFQNREFVSLLALQAWLNLLQNGVWVSCLPLAAKPYGRGTYQLAQILSLIVDPLAAALGFFIKLGMRALILIMVCITAILGYVMVLSLEAVTPPLLNEGGGALLVFLLGLGRVLQAYTKMRGNVLLKSVVPGRAEVSLMFSGVAAQFGAFVGSITLFLLINGTPFFRGGKP